MPKNKAFSTPAPVAPKPLPPLAPEAVKPEAPEAKVDNTSVLVLNAKGTFIREYSFKVHGKKFVDFGKEYANKIGGTYQFPILT